MGLLSNLGLGDRHPMHSAQAAAEVIALIPSENLLRALNDVTQWLRSVGEAPDFKPAVRFEVLGLLDEAGRKPERAMVLRYLKDPRLRNPAGQVAWSAACEFWSALADGYQRCVLDEFPHFAAGAAGRVPLAAMAARGIRARVGHIRTTMLRYKPVPAAAWLGLYTLLARCERAAVASVPTHAYPDENLHTTPVMELMKGLLVAVAAPERLPPEEIEAAYRIAQRYAGAGKLQAAPFEGATHGFRIDAGAPPVAVAGLQPGPQARFFGAGEALGKLAHMMGQHEAAMMDEEERVAREYSPGQKVTVLRQFAAYWGAHPPQPEKNLIRLEGGLAVVHGFQAVCHYVPHVATQGPRGAEGKGLEVMEDEEIATPESWPERDAGMHTVHARAGGDAGLWAEVGDLAAIRIHDRKDWWLAAIRRLAPAQEGALEAEFEVLSRKPLSVWLRVLGQKGQTASRWETTGAFAYDYVPAVILTDVAAGAPATLVVPKGKSVPGLICELLHGEKSRFLRFTEFLEQGKDFDRCAFQWQASEER